MPKVVDHEQRRREIIAALWQIAAASGLEGVSLGQVAAAAGVSKGLVQHYFRTKDEMLVHATGRLREQLEHRIIAQVGAAPRTPRATLRAVLAALLPTDEAGRTEALVANAFLIRARADPALAARFREGNRLLREAIADLVDAAQREGELPADLDPTTEADLLLALVTGLAETLLVGHHTPPAALALLDHQLDRLD